MNNFLKYSFILSIIFCSSYDALSITTPNEQFEEVYIRITSDIIGVITGGEAVLDAGNNWFEVSEISGGYYKEIDENGIFLSGTTRQYNTSILLQQGGAFTSLLSTLLVQNHSLEVEIIFVTSEVTGAPHVGYEYVLETAELKSMQHINDKDFEVKMVRLDFISQMVEHTAQVGGVTSVITF